MKAETNDIHMIFLFKEKCQKQHYQDNIRIFIHHSTRDLEEMKDSNHISWTGIQVYRKQIQL